MKYIKANSPYVDGLLQNPLFIKRISTPVEINDKYDVPYLCGYNKNSKIVYIDRYLKRAFKYKGKTFDVVDFLTVHEVTEKALIDLFKLHYQKAHHLATHFESLAVKNAGINWWVYTKFLKPQIKTADHAAIRKVPPDLDLTPYDDEVDAIILRQLQNGESINKKRSTKEQFDLSYYKDQIVEEAVMLENDDMYTTELNTTELDDLN